MVFILSSELFMLMTDVYSYVTFVKINLIEIKKSVSTVN